MLKQLERRARRAYELSRLRRALWIALLIVPATAYSASRCANPWPCIAAGVALLALCVTLRWRGRLYSRVVNFGMAGGSVAYMMCSAAGPQATVCSTSGCWNSCVLTCSVGGVLGGFIAVCCAVGVGGLNRKAIAATIAVTALVGVLGSISAGATAVAATLLALVAAALLASIASSWTFAES